MARKKRSRNVPILKETLAVWAAESNGATIQLGDDLRPEWAKKKRSPEKDIILFCSCSGLENGYPVGDEKLVGRSSLIRRDDRETRKRARFKMYVYLYYENSEGDIFQRGLDSKKKRDHWMPKILDEYQGWRIVSGLIGLTELRKKIKKK